MPDSPSDYVLTNHLLFFFYSTLTLIKIEHMGIPENLEGNPKQAWLDTTQEYLDKVDKLVATNQRMTQEQYEFFESIRQHIARFMLLSQMEIFKRKS
jgi:hypothetical protein